MIIRSKSKLIIIIHNYSKKIYCKFNVPRETLKESLFYKTYLQQKNFLNKKNIKKQFFKINICLKIKNKKI